MNFVLVKFSFSLFLILCISFVSGQICPLDYPQQTGQATYYSATGAGDCSFGRC